MKRRRLLLISSLASAGLLALALWWWAWPSDPDPAPAPAASRPAADRVPERPAWDTVIPPPPQPDLSANRLKPIKPSQPIPGADLPSLEEQWFEGEPRPDFWVQVGADETGDWNFLDVHPYYRLAPAEVRHFRLGLPTTGAITCSHPEVKVQAYYAGLFTREPLRYGQGSHDQLWRNARWMEVDLRDLETPVPVTIYEDGRPVLVLQPPEVTLPYPEHWCVAPTLEDAVFARFARQHGQTSQPFQFRELPAEVREAALTGYHTYASTAGLSSDRLGQWGILPASPSLPRRSAAPPVRRQHP